MDETFRRRVPRPFMPRDKRSKRGENFLAENHGIAGHGRRAVLLQLVAAGLAADEMCIRDRDGIRFFRIPVPASRSAFLTVGLPVFVGEIQVFHVPCTSFLWP